MLLLVEATPSERAIYLTYLLVSGRALTAQEAAELLDVSVRTSQRILGRIARQAPVYRDDDGRWRLNEESISPY